MSDFVQSMRGAPEQFVFWTDFLRRVLEERREQIDLVLDTSRVRENWLQAEVFLAARRCKTPLLPFFYCNYCPRGYRGAVDWSYWDSDDYERDGIDNGARPLMLAELKFLGGDYLAKTFAGEGFDLASFLRSPEGQCIAREHAALAYPALGGLVADYCRLISYTRCACPIRMLVLLLDRRSLKSELGRCFESVEFERPVKPLIQTEKWLCKTWDIRESVGGAR